MSTDSARRRDVLIVSTSYPSSANPASGIFVARLAQKLTELASVQVVAPASVHEVMRDTAADQQAQGIKVYEFRYAPRAWQKLAQRAGGIPVALREEPILHALIPLFVLSMSVSVFRRLRPGTVIHANWAICAMFAGIAARLRGAPMLVTVRGEDVARAQDSRLHRFVLSCAIALSARVATVSEAFRELLAHQYPQAREKLVCVPNGVDDEFIQVGRNRTNEQLPNDPVPGTAVRLLTVGSLIPRKGIDQLLQAVARLPDSLDVELQIVGDGPLREALLEQTKTLGLNHRVRFSGPIEPHGIAAIMAAADIFVLASHSEGRPNAVIEAMACALPIVATDIDGVRELVVDGLNGRLVTDGAVDAMAAALGALIEQPALRKQYGAQGALRIEELGLRWEHTARRYHSLYEEMARVAG